MKISSSFTQLAISFIVVLFFLASCTPQASKEEKPDPVSVELVTSLGNIQLELSDKTPLHRDNFIKLVEEGRLDSMLFHRVLDGFVVQAGEYDSLKRSKMDSLDRAEMDYRIPAEIDTSLFHKRGALGAARTGNPERASSSLSFYFVQAGPRADSLIDVGQARINGWLQQHYFINAPQNKVWKDSLLMAEEEGDFDLTRRLTDSVNTMAKAFEYEGYVIPEQHREVYRTLGGTPHLDQNYTIFGEVIQGMDVVDSIASVSVNTAGRPAVNVYILSARIMTGESE